MMPKQMEKRNATKIISPDGVSGFCFVYHSILLGEVIIAKAKSFATALVEQSSFWVGVGAPHNTEGTN